MSVVHEPCHNDEIDQCDQSKLDDPPTELSPVLSVVDSEGKLHYNLLLFCYLWTVFSCPILASHLQNGCYQLALAIGLTLSTFLALTLATLLAFGHIISPNPSHFTCLLSGGLYLKPPKFEHIFVAVITFFPLSFVQILLIPACCLLCVL